MMEPYPPAIRQRFTAKVAPPAASPGGQDRNRREVVAADGMPSRSGVERHVQQIQGREGEIIQVLNGLGRSMDDGALSFPPPETRDGCRVFALCQFRQGDFPLCFYGPIQSGDLEEGDFRQGRGMMAAGHHHSRIGLANQINAMDGVMNLRGNRVQSDQVRLKSPDAFQHRLIDFTSLYPQPGLRGEAVKEGDRHAPLASIVRR